MRRAALPTLDYALILRDGGILAAVLACYVMGLLRLNPRLFLRQYPDLIRNAVAPNTRVERFAIAFLGFGLFTILWTGVYLSIRHYQAVHTSGFIGFFLHGFAVATVFNVTDWLILDELWLGRIQPRWALMPGAETLPHAIDHNRHFRGFIVGTVPSLVVAAFAALVALRFPT
jgi:hypothetical protein